MIRYTLKCKENHQFESWFQSASAYETLWDAGMVICPDCGVSDVVKSLMAPQVRPARTRAKPQDQSANDQSAPLPEAKAASDHPLSAPQNARETALARLKAEVEANSEYVGMNFATEARAIHDGDAPERAIYGEAKPEEAKSLIEDGVPVAPLPFTPGRKTN